MPKSAENFHPFDLALPDRIKLWNELSGLLENYYANIKDQRVSPPLELEKIRELAGKYSFEDQLAPAEALNHVLEAIKKYGVHTSHPGYYGLYNPRPNFAGIMADMITATLNPQMAAWSHAPFAVEAEDFVIQQMGKKFGFPANSIDGVFCGGGAEANHTAVICAINRALPEYAKSGFKTSQKDLLIYCSAESHHSIGKAAMMTGLGHDSIRLVSTDKNQQMVPELLEKQIHNDLKNGYHPFMIVATTGTTGSGAIDPIHEIAKIAHRYQLWLHADAAYGGAIVLDPESKHFLAGIEKADSITFDMHKWMSLPMGTSIFLTTDKEILLKSFRISTAYMPREADLLRVTDPYSHSIQWSRRFIGLRAYLSLLIFGWEGYALTIHQQILTGRYLKEQLLINKWQITNNTPLPVICFTDENYLANDDFTKRLCAQLIDSGSVWLSVYKVNDVNSLRACITNYSTTKKDIDDFVRLANELRANYSTQQQ